MIHGLEPMMHGLEPMMHGLEPMMHGLEPMMHGLEQWISTWGREPQSGREPFLEGSRVHILCTHLY